MVHHGGRPEIGCWKEWEIKILKDKADEGLAWPDIAALIPGRNARSCYVKWVKEFTEPLPKASTDLKPSDNKKYNAPWTADELKTLKESAAEGICWDKISKLLPDRSWLACFRKWVLDFLEPDKPYPREGPEYNIYSTKGKNAIHSDSIMAANTQVKDEDSQVAENNYNDDELQPLVESIEHDEFELPARSPPRARRPQIKRLPRNMAIPGVRKAARKSAFGSRVPQPESDTDTGSEIEVKSHAMHGLEIDVKSETAIEAPVEINSSAVRDSGAKIKSRNAPKPGITTIANAVRAQKELAGSEDGSVFEAEHSDHSEDGTDSAPMWELGSGDEMSQLSDDEPKRKRSYGFWTEADDDLLIKLANSGKLLREVRLHFPERTVQAVRERWRKLKSQKLVPAMPRERGPRRAIRRPPDEPNQDANNVSDDDSNTDHRDSDEHHVQTVADDASQLPDEDISEKPPPERITKRWSKAEDSRFIQLIDSGKTIQEVHDRVPDRSYHSVVEYWRFLWEKGRVQDEPYYAEDSTDLTSSKRQSRHRDNDDTEVAYPMSRRWTDAEDAKFIMLAKKGKTAGDIVRALPGRSLDGVTKHWETLWLRRLVPPRPPKINRFRAQIAQEDSSEYDDYGEDMAYFDELDDEGDVDDKSASNDEALSALADKQPKKGRAKWTKDDDRRLIELAKTVKSVQEATDQMPGKKYGMVASNWRRLRKSDLIVEKPKSRALKRSKPSHGTPDVRERVTINISDDDEDAQDVKPDSLMARARTYEPWKSAEDKLFIKLAKQGKTVAEIADALPGRTYTACETHWSVLKDRGLLPDRPRMRRLARLIAASTPNVADAQGMDVENIATYEPSGLSPEGLTTEKDRAWEDDDDRPVIKLAKEGKTTTEIAPFFPGRTFDSLRWRGQTLVKRGLLPKSTKPVYVTEGGTLPSLIDPQTSNEKSKRKHDDSIWTTAQDQIFLHLVNKGKPLDEFAKYFPLRSFKAVKNHMTELEEKKLLPKKQAQSSPPVVIDLDEYYKEPSSKDRPDPNPEMDDPSNPVASAGTKRKRKPSQWWTKAEDDLYVKLINQEKTLIEMGPSFPGRSLRALDQRYHVLARKKLLPEAHRLDRVTLEDDEALRAEWLVSDREQYWESSSSEDEQHPHTRLEAHGAGGQSNTTRSSSTFKRAPPSSAGNADLDHTQPRALHHVSHTPMPPWKRIRSNSNLPELLGPFSRQANREIVNQEGNRQQGEPINAVDWEDREAEWQKKIAEMKRQVEERRMIKEKEAAYQKEYEELARELGYS